MFNRNLMENQWPVDPSMKNHHEHHQITIFLSFSHGFPIEITIFPWFSHRNHHFPLVFQRQAAHWGGSAACCEHLLQAGADVALRTPREWTALHLAALQGQVEADGTCLGNVIIPIIGDNRSIFYIGDDFLLEYLYIFPLVREWDNMTISWSYIIILGVSVYDPLVSQIMG